MTTAIALPRRTEAALAHLAKPTSQLLARALADAINPHPEAGFAPLSSAIRPEAETRMRALNAVLEPAPIEVIVRWLAPIASVVANAPTGDDLRSRVRALAAAVQHLPGAAWTPEAQRDAIGRCRFWPSAADIIAIANDAARPLLTERNALRRLLDAPTPAPKPAAAEAWDAERAARMVAELRAEIRQREEARGIVASAKPAHLSPAHRAAAFRSLGQIETAERIEAAYGLTSEGARA